MAWTQADLDVLDAAIASGESEVAFSDRRVKYRSVTEQLRARDTMKRSLDAESGIKVLPRQSRVFTRKGWE